MVSHSAHRNLYLPKSPNTYPQITQMVFFV